MKRTLLTALLAATLVSAHAAPANTGVKVGFLSTLSGPAAGLGTDIRDGFQLAMKHLGGKLGGLPAEVIVADDKQDPNTAKQATERLLKKDKVDFMTGIVFSNILLTVAKPVLDSRTFFISANAGPSQLAGKDCNPYFFNVAWQNDNYAEAMGRWASNKGIKSAITIVPNYPAGKDMVSGFKRFYTGQIADEMYTKLGQLDYAAELAQLRAAKPDGIFVFLPGGMGINFVKQFVAAGLSREIQLIATGWQTDEDTLPAVGTALLGTFNSAHWAHDLDNAANRKFVADFEKTYGRLPSVYAAQGYDAAQLIDAAVRDTKGGLADKAAVRKALEAAKFASVRGKFRFNGNHFPVQDYYLRVVRKDDKGRITNKLMGTIFKDHADAYVGQCQMPQ